MFYFCLRMSTNNSQPGHSPSESIIENKENQSNIDQLLSVEFVATTQPSSSSSSIQFNPTDMMINIQQHNHVSTSQHARRGGGRQHQQESQQIQDEQRRLREEQRRLREEQQRLRQQQQQ